MKKIIYSSTLMIALCGIVACGGHDKQNQGNEANTDAQTESAGDNSDQNSESNTSTNTDGDSDEDPWCDSSYPQHCEGNKVTWCNAEEGTVTRLDCSEYVGRSCQEAVSGNMADCVASCETLGAEEKACSITDDTSEEVAILATAKCLEVKDGGYALFTVKRESCSSCTDLTCHISDKDKGDDLQVGEVCTAGTFRERCNNNQAFYCATNDETTIVSAQDCGDKICVADEAINYAACADSSSSGCTEGAITYQCGTGLYEFYSYKVKCIKDSASGNTYNVVIYSEPCANGINKTTCECEADEWR